MVKVMKQLTDEQKQLVLRFARLAVGERSSAVQVEMDGIAARLSMDPRDIMLLATKLALG